MSFGAIVAVKAVGTTFEPIPAELECALTEVRVEQSLNERTSFALRFQEDYGNDKPSITEHDLFKDSTELAILVPNGPGSDELICLVHGQIEQLSFDVALGGPGSSFEARGQDVRTMLDRVCVPESLEGVQSHVLIPQLIKDKIDNAVPDVDDGKIVYDGEGDNPYLNHVGTSLELIESLAAAENQTVWLSYHTKPTRLGPLVVALSIKTFFHVRASPARGDSPPPPPFNPFADKRPLRLLADSKECPNVANFKISSDNERIKVVNASAIDDGNDEPTKIEGTTPDDKTNDGGAGVDEAGGDAERSCCIPGAGSSTERAQAAEKAATDESWFLTAEALTSASMYGAVLEPDKVVQVLGVGCDWAGYYQVEEVTHVINAAEHWMNLKLRSNSRGKKKL